MQRLPEFLISHFSFLIKKLLTPHSSFLTCTESSRRLFLLGCLSLPAWLSAAGIREKFPSYRFVLRQFDIDPSYIDDPDFVRFVTRYEPKYRRFYENSLKRGKAYIPMLKSLFAKGGLSPLFMYMSMTESGFKPDAVSSKKAAGLWQFMSATARRFSLRVDGKTDERYDPRKSTRAAMRYIQTLYRMFGKWYLVMMAYNCGEGRLGRAIRKAGTDDFAVLMDDRKRFLPEETRNYLRKIVLLAMMGEKIRTSPKPVERKIRRAILPDTEVAVNFYGHISLEEVARLLRMNPGRLARLNPLVARAGVRDDLGLVQLFIPRDRLAYYQAFYRPPLLRDIFREKGYSRLIAHVVRKGEDLRTIARRYRVTPLDLIIANALKSTDVQPGKVLMIPVTEAYFERHRRI